MSVDESKLSFSSSWEIDQLINTNEDSPVSVSSGTTALYTITGDIALPDFKVHFKPNGSTKWYDSGANSTTGAFADVFTFTTYIENRVLYIQTASTGQARYYIWADKIDY